MIERILIVAGIVVMMFLLKVALEQFQRKHASRRIKINKEIGFTQGVRYIVYFWSNHCLQCKTAQKPVINKILASTDAPPVTECIEICVDNNMQSAREWKVQTLPTTFITDTNGNIKHVNNGFASEERLRKQLLN